MTMPRMTRSRNKACSGQGSVGCNDGSNENGEKLVQRASQEDMNNKRQCWGNSENIQDTEMTESSAETKERGKSYIRSLGT